MTAVSQLISKFVTLIVNPTILLLFSAGFMLFLWGLVMFIFKLDSGGDHKEGKDHMLWGLAGMLVMVCVYGIIALIISTINNFGGNSNITITSVPLFRSGR